ncbi:MAG: non-canonical purine NTP pyrophosphatase [Candidatus Aenigmarchaeota archaeon]|nr:non-canonical purine NTP pyrophosphatase [Candidatus Aenigmarchaeota archaeon]
MVVIQGEGKMTLYFITGNKKKFEEVKDILGDVEQIEMDLQEIQDLNPKKIIERKLEEAMKHHKGEFIIEDTSFYLDCLNGLPGPLIKWFLETIGTKGLYKIAHSFGNYGAETKTIIGYSNGKEMKFFEGSVRGKLVSPRKGNEFGYDPIFQPDGFSKTFGEMSMKEKNKISMRKVALTKLKDFLEQRNK